MVGRSRASITVVVAGCYLLVGGLGLILIPGPLLAALGIATPTDFWPRLVGGIVVEMAVLYLLAGRADSRSFATASIVARTWIAILLVALVISRRLGPVGLLVPVLDAAGAAWTWSTLRSEHRHTY